MGKLAVATSVILLAACSDAARNEPSDGRELFLGGTKWPDGIVPMCWSIDPPSSTDAVPRHTFATTQERDEFRLRVRRVLESGWPVVANVVITEFGDCVSTDPKGMVEIIVEDSDGGSASNGYPGKDGLSRMTLGFNRGDFWQGLIPHEFGHILGFHHEHDRPDFVVPPGWPDTDCGPAGPLTGDTLGTDSDVNSVLDSTGYCNNNAVLSRWDIIGVQKAYGPSARWEGLTGRGTFDPAFYLALYPDLRAAFGDDHEAATYHWVTHGLREGRRSSLEFDLAYYTSHYGDVEDAPVRAIDHWLEYGIPQCRSGSAEVDMYFYRDYYADLRAAFGSDCRAVSQHWLDHGLAEGRRGAANFDVGYYLNSHPDLTAAFGANYAAAALHWLTHGRSENRTAFADYDSFSLHTGTALHETDASWEFELAINGDLFAIAKSGTGSGTTEVHVLSAASGYQEFSLHTATALHETGDNVEFLLGENRDLYAIIKSGTGSGTTEVHALSAASNYGEFRFQTGTALHETNANWEFALYSNGDIFAFAKSGTGSGRTEVHSLSAETGYQSFTQHVATALHETGDDFQILLAPNLDLIAVKKSGTGTGSTEVHVMAVADGYQRMSVSTGTPLHETGASFDFALAPNRDIFAISKSATGSGSSEIHVLAR